MSPVVSACQIPAQSTAGRVGYGRVLRALLVACSTRKKRAPGPNLFHAYLAQAHQAENAEVAGEEAGLVRKRLREHNIHEWREIVPKIGYRINVIKVFPNVRGICPELLLCYRCLDGTILQRRPASDSKSVSCLPPRGAGGRRGRARSSSRQR